MIRLDENTSFTRTFSVINVLQFNVFLPSNSSNEMAAPRPNDMFWICLRCSFTNGAHNRFCLICGESQPSQRTQNPPFAHSSPMLNSGLPEAKPLDNSDALLQLLTDLTAYLRQNRASNAHLRRNAATAAVPMVRHMIFLCAQVCEFAYVWLLLNSCNPNQRRTLSSNSPCQPRNLTRHALSSRLLLRILTQSTLWPKIPLSTLNSTLS